MTRAAERRDAPCRRPTVPGAIPMAILAAVLSVAAGARAQLPLFESLPAWAPADSTSRLAARIDLGRFGDGRNGWIADRLLLDARLPLGGRSCIFLRLPYLRFDSAAERAAIRWPAIVGPDSIAGWPGESVVSGIGQMEIGAVGPLSLPGLGPLQGAIAAGVPLGEGRLYPFSSAGLPLRLGLTRWSRLSDSWWFSAAAVLVAHGGQSGDALAPSAFPSGWQAALAAERVGRDGGLRLGWDWHDRSGRREQILSAQVWLPWSGGSRFGLRAAREITGSPDRVAAWALGLMWRLEARPVATAKPAATETPSR